MTTEQQIKALAELDGWTETFWEQNDYLWGFRAGRSYSEPTPNKCYLTSYDAIIPLIQKQPLEVRDRIATKGGPISFMVTPAQLSEKLLRATGKWIE